MNLFTRNSPYYHLLKYLLFLLKHPVYTFYNPYAEHLLLYVPQSSNNTKTRHFLTPSLFVRLL